MKYSTDKLLFTEGSMSVYRVGDKVIECFSGAPYSTALNEASLCTFAYEAGLPTPRPIETSMDDEASYAVYECPAAYPLSYIPMEKWDDILMQRFVLLQISVHAKRAPGLYKLRERMHEKLGSSPLDPTKRYELHSALDELPKHNKLCHGSFLPENVLVTDSGELLIIGWSGATQGNASADASYTYLSFYLHYGAIVAEKYIDCFCKLSNIAREYVERWLPIVAASMLHGRSDTEVEALTQFIRKPGKRARNV